MRTDSNTQLQNAAEAVINPATEEKQDDILAAINDGDLADDDNSSTTLLDADGVFQGTYTDTFGYSAMSILVEADVASADGGLEVQFSCTGDAGSFHEGESYTIPANSTKFFTPPLQARYVRVKYTNGGDAQSSKFHLHTILRRYPVKWSSHNIDEAIKDQDDAELVKAVLTGNDGTTYRNVKTTQDGNLAISDNSSGLAIAQGNVTGVSFIHKFGGAPDFDVTDGFVSIWDGADDGGINEMQYNYSTTAAIDSVSSSSASDTFDVEVQGLDANWDLVVQTVTLNGQNRVALTTDLIRVFRMKNVGSADNVGSIYCFENDTLTGGVPDDTSLIRSVMQPGNNQTLMAVYTVPDGYTGYMRDWYASTAGAKRDSQHTIQLRARPTGGVFQLKHESNISVTGTSYIQHQYTEPEKFNAKTDIEMRADTDTDIAGVSAGFDIVLVAD